MRKILILALLFSAFWACDPKEGGDQKEESKEQIVNVYTHRHYDVDQQLFAQFEEASGVKVNVVNASADELIQKMETEGEASPADVLITVDAGRLGRAKTKGLLQSIESETLESIVPAHLIDADKQWFALTKRARIIAYAKDRVQPSELSTYEALAEDQWKNKVLIRSSSNIYNQSLMASIIANLGEDAAREWAEEIVDNMAREPKGNDRDQVKAILAGEGDLAIVNTYYVGRLLNSKDPEEVKAGESVGIFFPNQEGRGAHVNISGAGVAKHAPNKENAIKFIEYLASTEAQEVFAKANYEYPVNPAVEPADLLKSWGDFKEDQLPLSKLGENNKLASLVFDAAGWQ
ncbi:MAG: Fe(3+) ABC transporter substrate-binding protein [Bacteroidota bacterium]